MALVPVPHLMQRACEGGYAVGYFESWNLDSLQGVIDAAERAEAPIIIGFNGDFLSRENRLAEERLAVYAAMGRAAAESSAVPCGFIFNECPVDDWVRRAVDTGFNLVMPADPEASFQDYEQRVTQIVAYAHAKNVSVEAEIGELPCGASGTVADSGKLTDPDLAAQFVANTGIDLLAVSVGNVHIMIDGAQAVDLDHLAKIRDKVSIPLVLHGGTGITEDSLRAAVKLGITKVNYGTYLKQAYLKAMRESLGAKGNLNPHELLGIGGKADLLTAGRFAVRDAVLERIDLLGCRGKAWQ
jgi:ketose-bisphosphate aldolase